MKRITLIFTAAALVVTPGVFAQFNLNKLSEGLGKAKQATDTAKSHTETATKVAKGVAGIGIEEERVIGGSVSAEVIARYGGIERDEAATERLNLVGKGLARYSSRPGLDWRFGLLNSESINAFSAPSGYVFITKGLYQQIGDDDDALAAVLGHEIAHITEKHALKIVSRGEFLSGATSLATQYSRDAGIVEGQLRQFDLGIEDITKALFEKGFDPQTEYAADRKGRDLTVTAGYNPGAFRAMLVKLKGMPATDETKTAFSTHPSFDDRLKKLPADPKPAAAKP